MKRNDYELSVKINGSKLPEYGSHGKTYVRGEIGREFTLQFRNSTADRVLARFSIDGLSVLDGKSADKDSSGYLCDAYSSIEISGWRTSLDEVRRFEFSSKGKSYAGKTISTANCGVIGIRIYGEKEPPVKIIEKHIHHDHWYEKPTPRPPWNPWRPYWDEPMYGSSVGGLYGPGRFGYSDEATLKSSSKSKGPARGRMMACSSSPSEVTDYNLGTKFGESKSDHVKTVKFEVGSLISEFEIYYTDKEGLENAGVDLSKKPSVVVHPKAFGGFCQPPPDYDE
jgi:hypothetical protein